MTTRRTLGLLVVALVGVLGLALPAHGAGWVSRNIDGKGGSSGQVTGDMLGGNRASILLGGELHTFYFDSTGGNLRHAVNSGGVWHYETLDGAGGSNGRVDSFAGADPTAIVYGGLPYVFYRDEAAGTLRMATFGGNDWYFATLDGEGGPNGRVDSPCCIGTGLEPNALVWGGLPYVFYWDNGDGGHVLRIATWGGDDWHFGTLDGAGGPNGRVSASVGNRPSALVYGGLPYVFYGDGTNQDIRLATWGGSDWYFGVIDGAGGPNGRVDDPVTNPSAVVYGGLPYVFYDDFSGGQNLRMATWGGSDWFYATLDGLGGPNGRTDDYVSYPFAVITGGLPYVFYNGTTGIRMATWGGSDWFFGPVPVDAGPNRAIHPDAIDGLAAPAFVYEEDAYGQGLGYASWTP